MASTLSITDGTTTVSLITASGAGLYAINDLQLPPPVEVVSRATGYPFLDGGRMTASALDDRAWDIPFLIRGTSVDNVDSQVITLNRLLRQAVTWERDRTGSPVRVSFKRDGTTNTSYAVIKGVPAMPTFAGGSIGLGAETGQNVLTGTMTLLLEPVWHAGALTTILNAGAWTNTPSSNILTFTSTPAGDMPGPLTLKFDMTGKANNWTEAMVAITPGAPRIYNISGTADGAAWGGSASSESATGTAALADADLVILDNSVDEQYRYDLRMIARVKVTSGTASKLQLRGFWTPTNSTQPYIYQPWQTFDGASGAWRLIDLGSFRINQYFNRPETLLTPISWGIEHKTSDSSTVGYLLDYIEVVPYAGFVRTRGLNMDTSSFLIYESAQSAGSLIWPRPAPACYQTGAGNSLIENTQRYGALALLTPAQNQQVWLAGQSATTHTLGDTGTITVKHLPCYAQPLRGAA